MSAAVQDPDLSESAPGRRSPRTWPALLVLLFLPGITAEMLTASTPVIIYLTNPFSLITNTLLYGSGAILIREVARRRGLGWTSIMLLGAAYGIFEEGLVVNTWANPWLPQICVVTHGVATGICDYSRVGSINLIWAASLTFFHALISITIPILLVELMFPRRASRPWLGRKAPFVFIVAELLVLVFGLLLNFVSFRQHGFAGPPLGPYLIEIVLMATFITVALNIKPGAPSTNALTAPRPWTLRIFAFFAIAVSALFSSIMQSNNVSFQIALAIYGLVLALAIWRVATWTRRSGWNERHMLALASGAVGFFIFVWAPVLELAGTAGGHPTRGTALVALAYLIVLIILARRVAKRVRTTERDPSTGLPVPALAPA
jgi:hypothetical protein